ncbi:MAG: gliding motility-associated C-terminal domain-containing protein [Chitinophagaceae bacterium]|nr:gliding motility-associated C-terminal domain-containing protein [Chitinophagaceae bacterium]
MKPFQLIIFLMFALCAGAQQFTMQGSAVQAGSYTYTITEDALSQAGMVTNVYPIKLNRNFTIKFQLNFGIKDALGADGFAFLLSNVCSPPLTVGNGLGVLGINNSIAIEFDDWDNGSTFDDNSTDHTGIYADGNLSPAGSIIDGGVSPVCLLSGCGNVEDGQWHDVTVQWDYLSATSQKINIYFDGTLRASSTRNHISERFNNNNIVFWSVSGSTGGNSNLQQFRVEPNSNNVINACVGKIFTLTAPELGTGYKWSNGSLSATNTATFTVTINETITCTYKDYCGVQRTVNFLITANPNPVATVSNVVSCEANPLPVKATTNIPGTYNYVWTVPASVANPGNVASWNPGVSGTYSVVVTNTASGCSSASASGTATVIPAIKPMFTLIDTICSGELIPPLPSVSLNGVNGTWSPAINNLVTTKYVFTPVTAVCAFKDSMVIAVKKPPTVDLGNNQNICIGETILLKPAVTGIGLNYAWQDGTKDTVYKATAAGTYTVTVTNSCGADADAVDLKETVCKIFIPSAFTPNGDGLNDLFQISGAVFVKDFTMQVFNRWGQLIYTTNNAFNGWDGTYKGNVQNPGIYNYKISYTDIQNGTGVQTKGNVVLLR